MPNTYRCMYLLPKDEYEKLQKTGGGEASVKSEGQREGKGCLDNKEGGEKQQINNIDVSHGGTLLINTGPDGGQIPNIKGDGGNVVAVNGENGVKGGVGSRDGGGRRGGSVLNVPVPIPVGMSHSAPPPQPPPQPSVLSPQEMRLRENQLMKELVKERLAQLSGKKVAQTDQSTLIRTSIFTGAEGMGKIGKLFIN